MNNNVRYRIKFSKLSRLRFIGHLDLQSLFQLCIKRAQLPIAYSNGFNPHQLMSFALPLSLGMASVGEYLDIELINKEDTDIILNKLNLVMPDGLKVLEVRKLVQGEKNSASLVVAGVYEVTFPKEFTITETEIQEILDKTEINVIKKSKKKDVEINIRNKIYEVKLLQNIDKEIKVKLLIAAGSKDNLKPELIIKYLYEETGQFYNQFKPYYLRIDLLQKNNVKFQSIMQNGDNL